ncbi:hypothetical protein HYS94_04600 [Candidatus Daviesbacteria bacterium]|nr:hypothetical protein [Candidatus Daviesbacteria bacterium]
MLLYRFILIAVVVIFIISLVSKLIISRLNVYPGVNPHKLNLFAASISVLLLIGGILLWQEIAHKAISINLILIAILVSIICISIGFLLLELVDVIIRARWRAKIPIIIFMIFTPLFFFPKVSNQWTNKEENIPPDHTLCRCAGINYDYSRTDYCFGMTYSCKTEPDPTACKKGAEVYFNDDNPLLSRSDAVKIVSDFDRDISINEIKSNEEHDFEFKVEEPLFDSLKDINFSVSPNQEEINKILLVKTSLKKKLDSIPKFKDADFILTNSNKTILLKVSFIDLIPPALAEQYVRNIYPDAIVVKVEGSSYYPEKSNKIMLSIGIPNTKEDEFITFLQNKPEVERVVNLEEVQCPVKRTTLMPPIP